MNTRAAAWFAEVAATRSADKIGEWVNWRMGESTFRLAQNRQPRSEMIQIYTGDGKGKTTAAVGLAARASKYYEVLFLQVIKDGSSSEIESLKKIGKITARNFGNGTWIFKESDREKEKAKVLEAIDFAEKSYSDFQVIIIDELVTAVNLKIIPENAVLDLLNKVPENVEVVLTGRGATKDLIERADLVTEMKEIKHYYKKGVKARKGIES